MSWNQCLYRYHKTYGGSFLGSQEDDGMLLLSHKDRPLVVGVRMSGGGRYGPYPYVQARIPVTLGKPYKLTIGGEGALAGGVNAVLKLTPGVAGFTADYGYPEVTKKRLIRSENQPFTRLVLGDLDFRNALLACPDERVEVCPGPETDGVHLLTVTTEDTLTNSDWYVGYNGDYQDLYGSEEERRELAQKVEAEFFPRMDRFLDLARAAYNAVTQWPL